MTGALTLAALGGAAAAAAAVRPVACFEALVRAWLALGGVRSRRRRAGGIDLHVLERPGSPPPVVLLHGLGADAERWFPILSGLLRGRRLLAPSLPAHGRSGSPSSPFGVPDVARWMGEWLESETRGGEMDLVGFSLGGWVALHLALERPRKVRRLVLIASAGGRWEPPPARRLLAPETADDVRALLAVLAARPLRLPGFVVRDLLRRARLERRWLVDSALRGEGLVDERLAEVRAPTLIVWGREDRLVPPEAARRLAEGIPAARAVELPGCGHLPYWERRREVRALLEEFLR